MKDGKPWITESLEIEKPRKQFFSELAPRMVLGIDASGTLMLINIQGYSSIYKGLDIISLTEYLNTLNILHAINLDGGGSSTIYYNGQVVTALTEKCNEQECYKCPVLDDKCERKVTTILCFTQH